MHTPTLSVSPRTIFTSKPPNVRRRSAFKRARPRKREREERERSLWATKKEKVASSAAARCSKSFCTHTPPSVSPERSGITWRSHAKVQLFASKARGFSGHDMGHHTTTSVRPSAKKASMIHIGTKKNYNSVTQTSANIVPPQPILSRLDKQTAAVRRDPCVLLVHKGV